MFMMGDNRDNSKDSRYPGVGIIPVDNWLSARRCRIWMNWSIPKMRQALGTHRRWPIN